MSSFFVVRWRARRLFFFFFFVMYLFLFCVARDTNPTWQRFFATAMGKNKQGAKGELEKLDFANITCRQAVVEVSKMYVIAISNMHHNKH